MRREIKLAGPTLVATTLVATTLATAYVLISPPSLDLAAALFRTWLFRREPWGIWNNLWYSGHSTPGYSLLFPAAAAALTPQLAAAIAAATTALPFTLVAWRHRGPAALAGSLLFGAFTAVDLFTGRLPFALGLLPAAAAVLALDHGWWPLGAVLAGVSGLCSPVAALFAALIAAGYALSGAARRAGGGDGRPLRLDPPSRTREAGPAVDWTAAGRSAATRTAAGRAAAAARGAGPGLAVAAAALLPVLALQLAFPEGGTEPFELGTLLPVLAVAVIGAWFARDAPTLHACLLVYALALLLSYLIPNPAGSNVARLGTLLAAPVAATVLWGRRPRLLAAAILPLLYIGLQAPVQNVVVSAGRASTSAAFYRPLLDFLRSRGGPPFRIEVPFTALHWEAYRIAVHIPLARGWERQLDIRDNPIFYRPGALSAHSYRVWLHAHAVRFVALPATGLDPSARREAALIRSHPPYLQPLAHVGAWRVYAVRHATPIVQGPARLLALGPDWLTLRARRAGSVLLHVRYTPYWLLARGAGCVEPAGSSTRLLLRHSGIVRVEIRFALGRVGAHGARCTR